MNDNLESKFIVKIKIIRVISFNFLHLFQFQFYLYYIFIPLFYSIKWMTSLATPADSSTAVYFNSRSDKDSEPTKERNRMAALRYREKVFFEHNGQYTARSIYNSLFSEKLKSIQNVHNNSVMNRLYYLLGCFFQLMVELMSTGLFNPRSNSPVQFRLNIPTTILLTQLTKRYFFLSHFTSCYPTERN